MSYPTTRTTDPVKPALIELRRSSTWRPKLRVKDEWEILIMDSAGPGALAVGLKAGSKHDIHLMCKQLADEFAAAVKYIEGTDA